MSANAGEIQRLLAAQAELKALIRVTVASRMGSLMFLYGLSNLDDLRGAGGRGES